MNYTSLPTIDAAAKEGASVGIEVQAQERRSRLQFVSSGTVVLLDQGIVSGVSFLTTVSVGRFCSEAELGTYGLGFSLMVFVAGLQMALVSLPYTFRRGVLKAPVQHQLAGSTLMHNCAISGIATLALALAAAGAWITQAHAAAPLLAVLAIAMPFVLGRDFARRFDLAHLRPNSVLRLDLMVAGLQLSALAALIVAGWLSAESAFAAMALACGIASCLWIARKRAQFEIRPARILVDLRGNWNFAKWLFAGQLMSGLTANVLPWLLTAMVGIKLTATFIACLTIVNIANPLMFALSNVLAPHTAEVFATRGYAAVRAVVLKSSLLMGAVMAAVGFVILVGGPYVVKLLYEEKYSNQELTIAALAFSVCIASISLILHNGLCAIQRPRDDFYGWCVTLMVTCAVALLLIPKYEALGAACSVVAGEAAGVLTRGCLFFFRSPLALLGEARQ